MKVDIDLGKSYEDMGGPATISKAEKHYPSFTYSGEKSLNLPDEGTMVIRFKKRRETVSKEGDENHYNCEVEVTKITKIDGDSNAGGKQGGKATEDALDKLASEKSKSKGY